MFQRQPSVLRGITASGSWQNIKLKLLSRKYPAVVPLRISDVNIQSEFKSVGLFDGRYRSFLETMNELRPSLHRYCARMTGSVMDGEDIVQEALFEAYRKLDQYDESRPLKPWLFGIAHSRCIDFLRKRKARSEAKAASGFTETVEPPDLAHLSVRPAVERLVTSLPPMERACVLLKDVFEYSLEEISELVGSTVGGVKAALNRGRSKLESLQDRPAARPASTPENKQILQLYVERFNSRDWDGLRELISADARLLVADRYSGSFAAGGYLGVYSRMQVTWRLTLGEVDGEPSIILLNKRNGEWEIEGIIRLDIGADGRVEQISDYQHCPWILTAGSIVVRGSID